MVNHKEKVIELKNVGLTYRERKSFFKSESYTALKDISFDVYKGETLGIIGRNGAGKSTLLRLLAGIIKPDKGEIIHHTSSVSLMALAAGFDPNLSGRQNAVISGMLLGYSRKYITQHLQEIKAFSELNEFFEKPVKTYSSGMRTRLGFSVAMYVSPEVLLIDEVLGVGDVSFRKKAEQALENKIASDITVIIVSHSEHQVSSLAERIIWVDEGKVRSSGAPLEIFPEYNFNSSFSNISLKTKDCVIYKDFFISLENIKLINGIIYFNCVIIDFQDRNISSVICTNKNGDIIMSGPTKTPGMRNKYVNIKQSENARYHNGQALPNSSNYIYIITNNEKIRVVEFYLGEG